MLNHLSKHWWALGLRGIIAVLFGVAAFVWPRVTFVVLIQIFCAFAFVDGIMALMTAFRLRHPDERWWMLIVEGIVGVGVGVFGYLHPAATIAALVMFVSFWAVLTGALEILAAFQLRNVIENENMLLLAGALSIILGIAISVAPGAAVRVYTYMIGAYAFIAGTLLILLSLKLREIKPINEPSAI